MGATLLLLVTIVACTPVAPARKLIEFGWDEPDTAFLRRAIGRMERMPFDGCVFHAVLHTAQGATVNLAWRFWGAQAFRWEDAAQARDDLWHTPRARFRSSFLRLNVTPGQLDWYDDFSPVLANARLAARLAREGGAAGLLLDTEPYEAPLFDYRRQRWAGRRTWDDYAAQARQRGRELMSAFEQGYPGLTLFLTFGYELPWEESDAGQRPLAECTNGLLAPFLDGLTAGARSARIVDGYEFSYGFREAAEFDAAHRLVRGELTPIVEDPSRYQARVSIGFGLWLDNRWRRVGWNLESHGGNYFTPEALERSLCAALRRADEYVWLYSENPRWWTERGGAERLPEAYVAAIRRARRCAALPD